MPITFKMPKLSKLEIRMLAKGRGERFTPVGKREQLAVCRLWELGLMTVNGTYHSDNKTWTTLKGAFALMEAT